MINTNRQIDVSLVIVNWNTCKITCDCLRSVYEQTKGINFEVILVDNASSDGSVEMIKKEFLQVILIENSENRGFAAANNQGMAIAKGKYILLLNSDTLILDNAIKKVLVFTEENPNVAVVGCQVWENSNMLQKTCFKFQSPWNIFCASTGLAKLFPGSKFIGGDKMAWWSRTTQLEVDVVSGMFMFVRKEAIRVVGLMDESYFIYSEEADWCYRFKKAGWQNIFWPGAKIIHVDGGSKSSEQASVKMEVQKIKSVLIFVKKNYGYISFYLCSMTILLTSLLKLLISLLLSLVRPQKMRKRVHKFLGICRFCLTGRYADLPS